MGPLSLLWELVPQLPWPPQDVNDEGRLWGETTILGVDKREKKRLLTVGSYAGLSETKQILNLEIQSSY